MSTVNFLCTELALVPQGTTYVLESVLRKEKYFHSHNSCLDGFELCARKYKKLKNEIFFLPYVTPTLEGSSIR